MATFELRELAHDWRPMPGLLGPLERLVAHVVRAHRRRITLQHLARLDTVQIVDIGLDPDDVAAALAGDGEQLWHKLSRRG